MWLKKWSSPIILLTDLYKRQDWIAVSHGVEEETACADYIFRPASAKAEKEKKKILWKTESETWAHYLLPYPPILAFRLGET